MHPYKQKWRDTNGDRTFSYVSLLLNENREMREERNKKESEVANDKQMQNPHYSYIRTINN